MAEAETSGFNINEFRSNLDGHLASPANFRVLFSGANHNGNDRMLAYLCNAAQLPSRAFSTNEYTTHGPTQKIPYQNLYDDVVISIYCKDTMVQKTFFDSWQSMVYNPSSFTFNYPDEYVSDVVIEQFDHTGKITYSVKLINAYPLMSSSMDLNWGSHNQFHNLQITLSYHHWEPISSAGISGKAFDSFFKENNVYPNFDVGASLSDSGVEVLSSQGNQFIKSAPIRTKEDLFGAGKKIRGGRFGPNSPMGGVGKIG